MTQDSEELLRLAELEKAAGRFLSAADYYIAGLQAVQRKRRVTDLEERHVGYDGARTALQDAYAGRSIPRGNQ